jgi:hypothetical protein
MRCAIYFTPPADDPLSVAAVRWLGRDAYTGERLEGVECAGIIDSDRAFLTAPVRRFGFHADLMAPFQMSQGESTASLLSALKAFSTRRPCFHVPAMRILLLGDFFALVPAAPCEELDSLAAEVVTRFDRFRAPLGEAELSRRAGVQLNEMELRNLQRWGHPHVLENFRFNMPLTGPVPMSEREHVLHVLQHHFGELATRALMVGQVALFYEPETNAPLRVHSIHALAAEPDRKTA